MKPVVLVFGLLLAASSLVAPAGAQGIPGGIAHGAAVGGNTAGPVGAVVGGVVGGAIGGVEGLLGVDHHGYARPAYAPSRVVEERVVVDRRPRARSRLRNSRRLKHGHRPLRSQRYRRAY